MDSTLMFLFFKIKKKFKKENIEDSDFLHRRTYNPHKNIYVIVNTIFFLKKLPNNIYNQRHFLSLFKHP